MTCCYIFNPVLLYYITDRMQFPGDEAARQRRLLEKIAEAARGVNYIQLREKDLPSHDLELLALEAMRVVRENSLPATDNRKPATRLLINSRTDIALAAGMDGVHLRSEDISPTTVREIWEKSACGQPPTAVQNEIEGAVRRSASLLIGVSCHSISEVAAAAKVDENARADFAVFAPVFGKKDAPAIPPAGLETLRQACQQNIPVLALGGITLESAQACLDAGAAGIAGIRLFQENDIAEVVRRLRG